jgi:hypothetical protein
VWMEVRVIRWGVLVGMLVALVAALAAAPGE